MPESPRYTADDLAYFAHEYKGAPWMVHIAGPDTVLTRNGAVPFTKEAAHEAAHAYNELGKREREASEFAPLIRATVFHHGVPVESRTADAVTVTAVRKALIAESYEHLAAMKRLTAKRRAGEWLTPAEVDLFDALSKVNVYSYLLAAVLRRVEAAQGTAAASEMAQWFDTVMDVGNEVLEDANDDLDEQVRTPLDDQQLDVLTTPGCHECGIPFEFDGPKAQQSGTVHCRECAEAVAR